jgi:polyisoprenoid-binding protein YceI
VAGFDAEFSIKRGDFGITTYLAPDGGEGGGLGNTVSVTMFVEGVKQ